MIKKEDLCQGAELKEFLGYSGDGHIAFVRKVPENIGPRIDQVIVQIGMQRIIERQNIDVPVGVAQWVTCLAADKCLTADPWS